MNNGTDNMSDHDRDGAVALLEYCWPYTLDKCFTDRLSLTGKPPELTQSGNREYLDPTKADTCLLYTSPSPRDIGESRMPSSA